MFFSKRFLNSLKQILLEGNLGQLNLKLMIQKYMWVTESSMKISVIWHLIYDHSNPESLLLEREYYFKKDIVVTCRHICGYHISYIKRCNGNKSHKMISSHFRISGKMPNFCYFDSYLVYMIIPSTEKFGVDLLIVGCTEILNWFFDLFKVDIKPC